MRKHTLLNTYESLYAGRHFWTRKLITGGRHSVLFREIAPYIKGKNFLDAFAGGGRLSFMASRVAKQVDAYDFSKEAETMFSLIQKATGVNNVNFTRADTDTFNPQNAPYDVIAISGTLENLDDVDRDMKILTKMLKKGGILAIDSPSFHNLRGNIYNTLNRLFEFPMTKTDKRQIDLPFIEEMAKRYKYRVLRHVGLSYSLGGGELCVEDLKERIPLAALDAKVKIDKKVENRFFEWMSDEVKLGEEWNRNFERAGIYKKIQSVSLPHMYNLPKIKDKKIMDLVKIYYKDDFSRDLFYTDIAPYSSHGGNAVYILKKL